MKVTKKVKSMQMFRKPVTSIIQVFCYLFLLSLLSNESMTIIINIYLVKWDQKSRIT